MTIVAVVGLAVLGFGHAQPLNATNGTQPDPSVTYPVRFEHFTNGAPRTAVPRPTVSFPVRFDTPAAQRTVPAPQASYPINLFAQGGER
jgi:hypothetical protein